MDYINLDILKCSVLMAFSAAMLLKEFGGKLIVRKTEE